MDSKEMLNKFVPGLNKVQGKELQAHTTRTTTKHKDLARICFNQPRMPVDAQVPKEYLAASIAMAQLTVMKLTLQKCTQENPAAGELLRTYLKEEVSKW